MNTFERIYEAVKLIPCGTVATYGQIASIAGNPRWARVVGYALHVNPDQNTIKCHRVVKRDGSLSEAFAFGGENMQRKLLEDEGVQFDETGKVKMNEYLWDGIKRKDCRAVIFDFDGTIADSIMDLTLSIEEVFLKRGYPIPSVVDVKNAIGNGLKKLIERLITFDIDEKEFTELFEDFKTVYPRRICDNTHLYPNVLELIEKLTKKGFKIGVVSNKAHDDLVIIMKKLLPEIKCIKGSKDDTPRKPAPDGTIDALKELGVAKRNAVFVGDSKVDYDTAMNLGMDSVLVTWGYGKKEQLELCTNAIFVNSVEELEKILLK